jgi:pimeloyl-ACP methyl ester carboxylesterase
MKIRFEKFLFLPLAVSLVFVYISTNGQAVEPISNADEEWTAAGLLIGADAVDSADAKFRLPDEAVVCHADEIWTNELVATDFPAPEPVLSRTPVLFVPGLLGTKIKDQNNNFLWVDPDRMINPLRLDSYSDDFMSPLAFSDLLSPTDGSLELDEVLKEIKYAGQSSDYTKSLIYEFDKQGYTEGVDFFTFPYDWRYGVSGVYPDGKTNAILLKEKIDQLAQTSPTGKVDIVAHSMGGLIVKKYVMENVPKIGKLVFVGVPNLGAPRAAQALLMGTDFGVFGLNPQELKKISQNLPAAYDLLPSRAYADTRKYLTQIKPAGFLSTTVTPLDYGQSLAKLASEGANPTALGQADRLHSSFFDNFNDWQLMGIDAYNIIGCRSATFGSVEDWDNADGSHNHYGIGENITGDDTVPFESADSLLSGSGKKFYFKNAAHGKMPSADGIRQKIANIITGHDYGQYANLVSHEDLASDKTLCQLYGDNIIVKSPVDIFVTETDNGKHLHLGFDQDGNILREIPGASFDIIEGHKYVYLPTGEGQLYDIDLKGSDDGMFTLIKEKIENNEITAVQVFNDVPVTPEFSANLNIVGDNAIIIQDSGTQITPTDIDPQSAADILPPQTTALANGQAIKELYLADPAIELAAQDIAQDGQTPAGVFSISYSLDHTATTTVAGASVAVSVSGDGVHTLNFYATDKLGNKENTKTVSFSIYHKLDFKGFFSPVDMNGIYNIAKRGSTIPLKFQLFAGPMELKDTSYITNFSYAPVNCISGMPADEIESYATAASLIFYYEPVGGQFVYNWKTPRTPGKCFRLTATSRDSTQLSALFKLK